MHFLVILISKAHLYTRFDITVLTLYSTFTQLILHGAWEVRFERSCSYFSLLEHTALRRR